MGDVDNSYRIAVLVIFDNLLGSYFLWAPVFLCADSRTFTAIALVIQPLNCLTISNRYMIDMVFPILINIIWWS